MASRGTVLIAHPSADVYGSDLQLLETVDAIVSNGLSATCVLPGDGPLVERLQDHGATVQFLQFPVLRKSMMTPSGFISLCKSVLVTLPAMIRLVRDVGADALLVNTVTIPWWLLVGRLTRRHTVCHVHEAEEEGSRLILKLLAVPNLLAHRIVVNSYASRKALVSAIELLDRRTRVVHNGMSGPDPEPSVVRSRQVGDPASLVLVGRLSPRKGIDVAFEAVAELRADGRDVVLNVFGSVFPGYEWFRAELESRARRHDLRGCVVLHGYVSPTWAALETADIVLVPSRVEPFGNTAVEALLARRPLVASRVQGLAEIVTHGENGLLAEPGSGTDLARQIASLLDAPERAAEMAENGFRDAGLRFSSSTYRSAMLEALSVN